MNQDIFNQLSQEQDNFNAYQDRFKNELSNFDMDRRTQQITQQASNYAVDQAKKASGALSNQLLGTDITQTAVEAAPLLYKGGRYFRAKGASGIASDVREGASTALGAVQSRVGNAMNTLRGQVGDVVGRATAEGEDGYQSVQQRMQSMLDTPRARVADLAPDLPPIESRLQGAGGQINPGQAGDSTLARATASENLGPTPGRVYNAGSSASDGGMRGIDGRGIEGMGGGEFRVEGGQLIRTSTGAPADFRAAADPLGSRRTQFSRDDEPSFRGTAQSQARLDAMSREQEANIGEIPEFQRPVQPARAPPPTAQPEPEPEPEAPIPRGPPPTAQETYFGQGGRIAPTQPEIPTAAAPPSGYGTNPGQSAFTRARVNADDSPDNPSISSEPGSVPDEPASGARVNLTPWEPPEPSTRYDPSSVTNPLERVGEDAAEGAGVSEDVAEPELALAQPVLGAVARADIPVLSTVAEGAEDVVGDIGRGIEDLFTGGEDAPSAAPSQASTAPVAPATQDSLAPMRAGMGGGPSQGPLADFPEPPTGASPALQQRVAALPSREDPAVDPDLEDMNQRLQALREPTEPSMGAEPSLAAKSQPTSLLGGLEKDVERTAPAIEGEVESGAAELPGVGEVLMGVTALGGLVGGLFEHHEAQKAMDATQAPVAPSMPQAPRAPQESFQVAPTIDSTNFHNY